MILEKQYCQHLSLPSLLSSPSLSRFFPPSLAIINPISESVMVGDIFDDTQCWSRRAVSAAAAAQSYPNPLDNGANIVMESITPSSARFFFYTQCGIYRFDTFPGRPHSVLIGSETSITFQFYYRSLKKTKKTTDRCILFEKLGENLWKARRAANSSSSAFPLES